MTIVDDFRIADAVVAPYQRTYDELRTETEKRIDAEIKARVEAGIVFLQEKYGPDWVEHIDFEAFDISDTRACVLGQLYAEQAKKHDTNGYDWACLYFFGGRSGWEYGFFTDDSDWGELQEEWERVIAERQAAV